VSFKKTLALIIYITLVVSACANSVNSAANGPQEIPFVELETTTTTLRYKVSLGDEEIPFTELTEHSEPQAGITPTGVVVPILNKTDKEWEVLTSCQNVATVNSLEPISRPHVILDAGHGGNESGAVSIDGVKESELNLQVALKTKDILEERGANVALTRSKDYAMTVGTRGYLAKKLDPALFVSIHHNSGNPYPSPKPGTMVYTKTSSENSKQFGGIFYKNLTSELETIAESKSEEYQTYKQLLDDHEAAVDAYDQSVDARNKALFENDQIDTPTTIPKNEEPPRQRIQNTTTTRPSTSETTVKVPDSITPPSSFEHEKVEEFYWVGGANAGVRSWTQDDGKDYLGVLRHSGDVPAALVEFLYLSNESESKLLLDPDYVNLQAEILANSITDYFSQTNDGTGFVEDEHGFQDIGNSGGRNQCVEPELE